MNRNLASQLRKRLLSLRRQRSKIEEEILALREHLRASLLKRYLSAGGKRRQSPAHYLCVRRSDGRNQFIYVRKANLARVKSQVEAHKRYRECLSRLRTVNKEILNAFKSLGDSLEVEVRS